MPSITNISSSGLSRSFGSTRALHPIDLDVQAGITGLLGPNGSGKSTFMRCLVGLVRPDSGTAVVAGVDLEGDGVAIRQRVTYAPGELALYGELRASEHLDFLLRGRNHQALDRSRELAKALGLPLHKKVRGYSHGMKRQLVFAAAMAPDVSVRILDEPTEGLDPTKRAQVLEMMADDAQDGRTILLSSHHLGEVDAVCENLAFLDGGRLVSVENAKQVAERTSRIVRLWWTAGVPADACQVLSAAGEERVRNLEDHLLVHLSSSDPRPFLKRLADAPLPAPSAVEHGRISLALLYREIYGVDGI
ncbi:MAG: ATP-binding cassette domain-containing protein [bacterium]